MVNIRMKEYYGDLLKIVTMYRPGPGHFAKIKQRRGEVAAAGQWFYCRDLWHNEGQTTRDFLYSHITGKGKSLAAFVHRFEGHVNARPFTLFGPTQRKTITWVQLSPWWKTSMRRSLFTLLLRVGHKYSVERHNFEEALYSTEMTRQSRPALERFLAGHTLYKGRLCGWYNQFGRPDRNITSELLDRLLVTPS